MRPMELLRFSRTIPVSRVVGSVVNKRMNESLVKNNAWMAQRDPVLGAMLYQRPFQKIETNNTNDVLQAMNRNARKPKRANKGARPCSRVSRRAKKRAYGNWRR